MTIEYDHASNLHTIEGAAAALRSALGSNIPRSFLDVGCGTGTWLRAAADLGVADLAGVDGIVPEVLHVPRDLITRWDLSRSFHLGRRFDVAICLEVAEHLDEQCASDLIRSLISHSELILFSAACPGQPGQHHVNCQWPVYWQEHFNRHGFACNDTVRWQIWDDNRVEPWYRQNMFWARLTPGEAGSEPRLRRVIHPEMMSGISCRAASNAIQSIETGERSMGWYLTTLAQVALAKAARRATKTING